MSSETHAVLAGVIFCPTLVLAPGAMRFGIVDWDRCWSDPPKGAKTCRLLPVFRDVSSNRTRGASVLAACAMLLLVMVDTLAPPAGALR
ncbi:MAG: hypothetical protein AAF192_10785 [Pseudomonadota bacterium]